ncbi:penicillin acylase family protein [Flindersiella endophytica]
MTAPVSVPGLRRPVEIIVDRWGIPHIYAENTDDLYVAQGFNAARDRLFQIDMWRRRGLGELASVLGPSCAEADRAARLFLYRGSLAEEWASYSFDAERVASCFTAGINAYVDWLSEHPDELPPEFTRLGYLPARWAPADVVRIRSHGPQLNVLTEFVRAKLAAVGGVDADRLRQPLKPSHAPFVPDDVDLDLPDDLLRTYHLGAIVANAPTSTPGIGSGVGADQDGSNNWALAAHRTTTGRPILASDPHRAYSTPSLRYIAHLSAPGLDVIGAGEPALPGVTLGHNGTAAFGFTIFPIDCQDIYVYDLDPADAGRYRFGDGFESFRMECESLAVKGESDRVVELAFTRHGPVIYVDAKAGKAYAIRTMWTEPGTSAYFGSIDYQGATSWESFRAALDNWGSPGENLLYADTAGTIAWKAAGRTPRRVGYDGLLPVPGDGRYDWDGYYAASELPEVVNPPEGFWATANEYNLPPDFPRDVRLSYEWADPSRYRRIVEELSKDKLFSLEDSQRLQVDVLSVSAREVVPALRDLPGGDGDAGVASALRLLTSWDFVETADSAAAALYHLWTGRHLAPALAQALLPAQAAKLLTAVEPEAMRSVLADPEAWFGVGGGEVLDELLRATLSSAYVEAEDLLGPDPSGWAWGSLHTNLQPHLLGSLEPSWNVGPVPIGGSGQTVNATHSFAEDFRQTIGASFRMVIDVGGWDNSVCINTPGQSGDPRSPHYRDLHDHWHQGEYVPMLYTREAVEAAATQRILLEPPVEG